MNTSTIKAFYAANKKAIIIGAVVLAIAANSQEFKQGFDSSYGNQSMYGQNQRQQPQQQHVGFFSKWFGGSNENQQANYNNNGFAGSNGAGNYAGYTGNTSGYAGANNSSADITSGYYKQQAANDASAEKFDDYIRDQGNYDDGNGNTYKMSSQYDNNYVNENTNEAVQTNDPSYNPGSSYTAVTPSDYSSSAPAATTTEGGE